MHKTKERNTNRAKSHAVAEGSAVVSAYRAMLSATTIIQRLPEGVHGKGLYGPIPARPSERRGQDKGRRVPAGSGIGASQPWHSVEARMY